jgi:hypothetical protein
MNEVVLARNKRGRIKITYKMASRALGKIPGFSGLP